jgi:tRNA-specific adenosine deaminase 3
MNILPTLPKLAYTEGTTEKPDHTLFVVVCSTDVIEEDELGSLLQKCPTIPADLPKLNLYKVPIPKMAPVSAVQAANLTSTVWPVLYKPGAAYGPHKNYLQKSQAVIEKDAGEFMKIARQVGESAKTCNIGEHVGAVIVSYNEECQSEILAAAGDARWCHDPQHKETLYGNVMAHAVLRAIGMVCRKRLKSSGKEQSSRQSGEEFFFDKPMTDCETRYFEQGEPSADSYLCLGLTIYLSHEPCVMCSMAILHSRFDRVIIGKRMPLTGGITAEHQMLTQESAVPDGNTEAIKAPADELGYGLFYRSELNWKLLAWEWKDCVDGEDEEGEKISSETFLHA